MVRTDDPLSWQRGRTHVRPRRSVADPPNEILKPSPSHAHRMSPPRKSGIPATVAPTASVSNAPDGSTIGRYAVVYDTAHLEKRVHVHEFSVVNPRAVLGKGADVGPHCVIDHGAVIGSNARLGSHCKLGRGAIVGKGAVLGDGASLDPGCHLGVDAFLGPGARLLDRTRLPTSEPGKPAEVGDRTRIGGNAVVCGGITVGADAVVAAG